MAKGLFFNAEFFVRGFAGEVKGKVKAKSYDSLRETILSEKQPDCLQVKRKYKDWSLTKETRLCTLNKFRNLEYSDDLLHFDWKS